MEKYHNEKELGELSSRMRFHCFVLVDDVVFIRCDGRSLPGAQCMGALLPGV